MTHSDHALEAGAYKAYTDRIPDLEVQARRLICGRNNLDVGEEGLVVPSGEVGEVKELKEGPVSIICFDNIRDRMSTNDLPNDPGRGVDGDFGFDHLARGE